jgi:excisionase family DNA binding protein
MLSKQLTVSVAEAAEITGMTQHAVRRAIRDGTVPCIKVGRLIRVPRLPLLRLLGAELNITEETGLRA